MLISYGMVGTLISSSSLADPAENDANANCPTADKTASTPRLFWRLPDGRSLGAEIGPGLQVIERIDHATADLSVLRSSAVSAVLFERPAGKAPESAQPRACAESVAASRPADRA
jgi:hypothetical protein